MMPVRSTKLLAFAYWELRRFFRTFLHDDGYSDWKALAVICCAQLGGIMAAVSVISIILGHRILPASRASMYSFAIALACGVTAVNYYALRFQNKWARFEAEFEHYSARAQTLGRLAVFVAVIVIAVTTLLAAAAASHLPR
jgi:multisubunit Na+/H+ antiporter MnhB subunit